MIIIDDEVIPYQHIPTALDGQARGNKRQDPAGVVVYEVTFYKRVPAILYLNAGDAIKYLVEHHVDVV